MQPMQPAEFKTHVNPNENKD